MKSKKIPYGYHQITPEDIESVVSVLKQSFLTQGSKVPEFEEILNKKVNSKFSVAVNSATSALHLACLALGLKKGDYLWTSPISFVSSANCGLFCNASVDFVDIDLNTGLMSIDALKRKLINAKENGILPKIVIPVHLGGTSCDMEAIYKLSKEFDFKIIEDASHALGGKFDEFKVGSCQYSDITVFSFHPVKIITTGEGGILSTNNESIYSQLKLLRSHGIVKDKDKFIISNNKPWHYEQQILGYNFRMSDINAALGISQINRLEYIVNRRNEILESYKKRLENLPIKFLKIPFNILSSVHLAIISFENQSSEFQKKVFNEFHKRNIYVQLHYQPIHLNPYYLKKGFSKGDFPNAEKYAESSLSIPVYPSMNEEEFEYVVNSIHSIFNEK
tara:strand:- start:1333 stop:2505 length:1173 start_codon:yes stop_codon:yes gene_type:complete